MSTQIHKFVEEARAGTNPRVVCALQSGWLVMAQQQVLPGYCLLLPDPVVPHLNAMESNHRTLFLDEMAKVGDVLLGLTGAVRINYEMLGNAEPALHAHLFPRYANEVEELRTRPIWFYDWDSAPTFNLHEHESFMHSLRSSLISSQPGMVK